MSTVSSRQSSGLAPQPAKSRNWISEIKTKPKNRPGAIIIVGPPGVGKSSLAGNIPGAVVLPFQLEDTWSQLKAIGSVPDDLAVLPPAGNWYDMMGMLQSLAEGEHSYTSLVIDTIGCAEIFCHERVCHEQLKGKWGEDGFAGYQRGYEMALPSWRELLNALDRLRDERKMRTILLGHTKIAPYKNPTGPDFDRIVPDVHHKTWSMTHKWADAVLYCNFFVHVEEQKGKRHKATGGQDRVIYTEYDAAYDAKNRYGMPPEISMGSNGKEAWDNIVAAITAGRKQAQPAA